MNQAVQKQRAAMAAMQFIEDDMIVGVGTGSTVNYFIEALAEKKHTIDAAIASSEATENLLREHHIPVIDLNVASRVPIYIDGADEANTHKQLIKGGGGALTREKILAATAEQFVCIIDASKSVNTLGEFPLAVEVIPMARSYVARQIVKLGGDPEYREGFVTDNGNIILDINNLNIETPIALEEALNNITGVVTNGLFAKRPADKLIIANDTDIQVL